MARYEEGMWQSNSGKYEEAAKDLERSRRKTRTGWSLMLSWRRFTIACIVLQDGAKERAIVDKLTAEQQTQMPRKQ